MMKTTTKAHTVRHRFMLLAMCVATAGLASCAVAPTGPGLEPGGKTPHALLEQPDVQPSDGLEAPEATEGPLSLEDAWGVEVVGVRLAAAGFMVDFRYRVIDPDKALPLMDRTAGAYLIDRASGHGISVPTTKVGPMRQTLKYGKPKAGHTYFVLFNNPGGLIKAGSKVDVLIGEFRAENLTVQ